MPKKIDYASMYTLRADGRYMGYYKCPVEKRRKPAYHRDPEALHRKIQELEKPRELTFKEAADAWWVNHVEGLAPGTQSCYNAPFKYAVGEHGALTLKEVTAEEINRVLLYQKSRNYSYKRAATLRSIYSQVFNYAISDMGQVLINPASAVKVPRGLKRTKREAPEDDVVKVIQDNAGAPFGLFPLFLLYTGFRVGEALGVKWEDVDFEAKTISCKRSIERRTGKPYESVPKTDSGYRTVPLLDNLAQWMTMPKGAKPGDYVFSNEGRLYTTSEVRSRWVAWCKVAGLAKRVEATIKGKDGKEKRKTYYTGAITEHQLRHGYATLCYEAGIDELTCMELMGHANVEMVRRTYTHLRQKQKSKAADLLNAKMAEIQNHK